MDGNRRKENFDLILLYLEQFVFFLQHFHATFERGQALNIIKNDVRKVCLLRRFPNTIFFPPFTQSHTISSFTCDEFTSFPNSDTYSNSFLRQEGERLTRGEGIDVDEKIKPLTGLLDLLRRCPPYAPTRLLFSEKRVF